MRVLHVEDDDNDAFFIARAISKCLEGVELLRLKSGEEGVAYFRGEGAFGDRERFPLPDVLLVDLKMGAVSGFEVLKAARGTAALRVVLSSSNHASDRKEASRLGAQAYLVKAMDYHELCCWLLEVLKKDSI